MYCEEGLQVRKRRRHRKPYVATVRVKAPVTGAHHRRPLYARVRSVEAGLSVGGRGVVHVLEELAASVAECAAVRRRWRMPPAGE